jgi:hypothetical protein
LEKIALSPLSLVGILLEEQTAAEFFKELSRRKSKYLQSTVEYLME